MTPVLVAGASARAAAASFARAGYAVTAIDLFADEDCRGLGPCHPVPPGDYPAAIVKIAATLSPTPWAYVGGLENHPAVIQAVSERHPLLGNPPEVLTCVRDRRSLARLVATVPDVAMPEALPPDEPTPRDGTWLAKPARSAAGHGVRVSPPGETGDHRERLAEGRALGVTYLTTRHATAVWGVSEPLPPGFRVAGHPFRYVGGTAPAVVTPELAATFRHLGQRLASATGLIGAWNLDVVVTGERVYVLECNPRLTASVDLFDTTYRNSLADAHARACRGEAVEPCHTPTGHAAKWVYHCDTPVTWAIDAAETMDFITIADRPKMHRRFARHEPVATLLSTGDTRQGCVDSLRAGREWIRTRLEPS